MKFVSPLKSSCEFSEPCPLPENTLALLNLIPVSKTTFAFLLVAFVVVKARYEVLALVKLTSPVPSKYRSA